MTRTLARGLAGRPIAWHWAVAAVCFAALALIRASEGSSKAAAAFGFLALVGVMLAAVRKRGAVRPAPEAVSVPGAPRGLPDTERVRRTHEVYATRCTSWRVTACVALAVATVGLAYFPLLALVAAPVTGLAALKQRRYSRDRTTLARELALRGVAVG